MSASTILARNIVRQLIELGIEDVVLSPGSRNAPLSIACYQAEAKGLIRLHVRIDERGAAFFALGISKVTNKYVPVICTSGTAVANYLPAVLEAYHSDLNLLILSADRPARLRRTGSNQTTLQSGIFGEFTRRTADTSTPIDISRMLNGAGPVHINLQFDEPLLEDIESDWLSAIKHTEIGVAASERIKIEVPSARNILVVGHDRAGFGVKEIEQLARDLAAPIIAEDPLSFSGAIAHAPILLSEEQVRRALSPDLAVVIGRTTLSRSINAFLNKAQQVLVIDPRTVDIDTERSATRVISSIPQVSSHLVRDDGWFAAWQRFETIVKEAVSEFPPWSEGAIASLIAADLENDTALFISSSRPIRDFEAFAAPRSGVRTYANRGLAGIDGNLSTAMGIATHNDETYAVVGDLAFLHDISALANPTCDVLTLIVIDNDGGGIFSTLPQRGVEGFEKLFGTPHGRDLAKICDGFGISHEIVNNPKELHIALQRIYPNLHVIIAKVPEREVNADYLSRLLDRYRELISR